MENAWTRLDAWFGDKNLFVKDMMQDIKSVTSIKDGDDERLMDYYVTLQAHIEEARSAGALDMLLIPANVELMVLPLTAWEKRVWREAQGRLPAEDRFLVHEHIRRREAAVRHQHGGHKREACASQGDPVLQIAEVAVLGGSRGAIQSPRIIREECEDHGRDGE
jgi:hypothetical protein